MINASLRAGELNRANDPSNIPYEFREAVELYARRSGRHGTIGWNGWTRCNVVEFTLKPDDPRLKAWQEGKLKKEPKETILLHYQPKPGAPYQAINLAELGVSGLVEMLEKANTWSGRGEYRSVVEAVQAAARHNDNLREQMRNAKRQGSVERGLDLDHYMRTPFSAVPENIGAKADG